MRFFLLAHLPLFSPFPEISRTCHLQGAAADDAAGGDTAPHATQSPLPHQVTSLSHVWGGTFCCLALVHVWAESLVGSVPASGRSFSFGSQTARSFPLKPGFGVVRVPLGCSDPVSHKCFFELQNLLDYIKIKTDIGSPGSLAAWRDRGDVLSSTIRFWLEEHPSCMLRVTCCPAPTSRWDTTAWEAPAALKAKTVVV